MLAMDLLRAVQQIRERQIEQGLDLGDAPALLVALGLAGRMNAMGCVCRFMFAVLHKGGKLEGMHLQVKDADLSILLRSILNIRSRIWQALPASLLLCVR